MIFYLWALEGIGALVWWYCTIYCCSFQKGFVVFFCIRWIFECVKIDMMNEMITVL